MIPLKLEPDRLFSPEPGQRALARALYATVKDLSKQQIGQIVYTPMVNEAGKVAIEESLSMPEQRVQPSQYRAFAAFARAVDEAQSGELQVE